MYIEGEIKTKSILIISNVSNLTKDHNEATHHVMNLYKTPYMYIHVSDY